MYPEDVRDFADRHTRDRAKKASGTGKKQADTGDDDESDEPEVLLPRQRKVSCLSYSSESSRYSNSYSWQNAHASIMAFLGDQSDSE